MKYKKIITSGCSFSDPSTPYSWPIQLENYVNRTYPDVKFDHRGLSSQGQDLIQKKAIHAVHDALAEGYTTEDLAVFVMWSSSDRKAFYVNNQDYINSIIENWGNSTQGWQLQFGDLRNKSSNPNQIQTKSDYNNTINYNADGGWLVTSVHTLDNLKPFRDYYLMGSRQGLLPLGNIHESLENIIMLQNFCQAKGIKLYQQYFMDLVHRDFLATKEHQIIKYLYDQLDHSTFILPNGSIHGYLEGNPECFKSPNDAHPNGLGHRRWLVEVILPHIEEDDFFL